MKPKPPVPDPPGAGFFAAAKNFFKKDVDTAEKRWYYTFKGSACPSVCYAIKQRVRLPFLYITEITRQPGGRRILSMLLYLISRISNIFSVKKIGMLSMSISVADNYALPKAEAHYDTNAWNPSSRQSLHIPIRS